jgi:hypothetical protein
LYHHIELEMLNIQELNLNFGCLMPLSAISWQPVLVVEEAGGPVENH